MCLTHRYYLSTGRIWICFFYYGVVCIFILLWNLSFSLNFRSNSMMSLFTSFIRWGKILDRVLIIQSNFCLIHISINWLFSVSSYYLFHVLLNLVFLFNLCCVKMVSYYVVIPGISCVILSHVMGCIIVDVIQPTYHLLLRLVVGQIFCVW